MAEENVLEEFLVNVLYNVDERKRRDFNEGLTESFVKAKLLGDALESMASRGVSAIERYVNGMERLYYVSRNTGASVQNLQALGFAAAQLGGNAEDAVSAVTGLVAKLKETPGTALFIKNALGVDVNGRDPTAVVMDMVKRLEQLPTYMRLKYEQIIGLTEQQYLVLSNPDVGRQMERYRARQDQMGLDPQKASADAAEFMRAWRDIGSVIDNIGSLIMSKIVGGAAPELTHFSDYLAQHGPEIADAIVKIMNSVAVLLTKILEFLPHLADMTAGFGGWDKILTAVGAALLAILGTMGLLSALVLPEWLLVMLGVGGAAVLADGLSKTHLGATESEILKKEAGTQENDESNWNPRNWLPKALGGYKPGDSPREQREAADGNSFKADNRGVGKLGRNTNARAAIDELRKAGYNDNAIAAVIGSMQTESTFNPYAHNSVGGGHTGAWQWDHTRWPKIAHWIKQHGGDPFDFRWQTKAWIAEHNAKPGDPLYDIPKTEQGGQILKNNPTLNAAIHGVQLSERFGVGEEGGRARHAATWLPHLNDAPPLSAPASTAGGDASEAHSDVSDGVGGRGRHAPPGIGDGSKVPMPANMPRGVDILPRSSEARSGAAFDKAPKTYIPSYGGLGGVQRAFRSDGAAAAMGIRPIGNSSSVTNAPSVTNHFNINGAESPAATADKVHHKISDVHSDLARNMRNAVG